MLPLLAAACCVAAAPGFEEIVLPEPTAPALTRVFHLGAQLDFVHTLQPDMKTIYARRDPLALDVWGAWLFGERAGVGLRGGVSRRRGTGVAPSDVTAPDVILWQVPIAVEGRLRLALVRDQPVVPYLRAGIGVVLAWEKVFLADPAAAPADDAVDAEVVEEEEAPTNTEPTAGREPYHTWFGAKAAVHGGGGVQIRVPFPEIQWEGTMAGATFLSDVYVYVEGWGRAANNFGADGVDLSAVGLSVGATVLF